MKKIYFLLISLLLSISAFPSQTTEGTEFWVTFLNNNDNYNGGLILKLIVSSRNDGNVRVENLQTGWNVNIDVKANVIGEIQVPISEGYTSSGAVVENRGLKVTSTTPIALYASNYYEFTYDATIVLPITGLGDEYVIQTFESQIREKEFAIVATEDNTIVSITPNATTSDGRVAGKSFDITLQKGQTYQVMSSSSYEELSGSYVKSNKLIAVFAGHKCATIPDGNAACDHIVEQQLPTAMWGKNFALTKTYGQTGDYIRVTALKDNTNIVLNGSNVAIINARETYTFRLTQNSSYLEASAPVACYLYIEGGAANYDMSDPSAVLISPIEQRLQEVTFATFETNKSRSHYVNVITTELGSKYTELDKQNIANKFSPLNGNDKLYFAQIPIAHGTHTLKTNSEGFIGHVYGLGEWESYAYSVGSSTLNLAGQIIIGGVINSDMDTTIERCYKKPITFSPQTNDDYDEIEWNFGDGNTSNEAIVTHTYSAPGTYDISMIIANEDGRDTAYAHLTLTDVLHDTIPVELCSGESFMVGGESFTYTKSGMYDITILSVDGCDSIVTVDLIVKPTDTITLYDTICDGRSYIWDGDEYTKTGVYTKKYTNQYGCDSTVILNLTISAPYNHEFSEVICAGETYTWDGKKYNETGVYPRKYSSVEGCDSLVTLYLTVGEVYDIEIFDTICDGEVYLWNKVKYTESGSYTQEFETIYGCDSVVTVHLFVAPIVREEIIEAICQGEPYRFGNTTLVKPGVYVDTALSMHGCDSITTLTLRVHEPYLIDQYIEACHNDTFMFRGMLIDKPGIYYDSMLTQHGCDSVYRLIYNKTPTYMFQEEDSICVGSTYNFRGMTLTKPGVYYDSLSTVSGCDSIYKLILHNFSHSDIYSIEVADVCGDNQTLHLVAQYEGQRPEYYNIIYSQEANDQGFKNIIQVPFTTDTIEAPMPNATPYIHPDYYELTLQLGNYKCPKAVTEHTTDFLVRYPSWIIEQNWQDVVAVLNAQYNGGYTFESYEWYVNNQPASQNKSYLYLPTLRVGDEVELHVMRQGEDYYVPTCPIIIEEQDTYNQEHPTLVTPARVSRHDRQVSLEAQTAATQYYLYDITGRCLLAGVCELGQVQQFELPNVAGSYFLTMVDAENHQQTIHMVID